MPEYFAAKDQISSVGNSSGVFLNPTARVTNVMVTVPSSAATGNITLQMTLEVPSLGNPPPYIWSNVSSIHISSAMYPDGQVYTFLSPVSGLRLASSVYSSTTPLVMSVLQEIIA